MGEHKLTSASIAFCAVSVQSHRVTAKRIVLETVERLPEDASFEEITRRLEVVAAIQKGLDSLDRGEGKSIDEVEKLSASWTTKIHAVVTA